MKPILISLIAIGVLFPQSLPTVGLLETQDDSHSNIAVIVNQKIKSSLMNTELYNIADANKVKEINSAQYLMSTGAYVSSVELGKLKGWDYLISSQVYSVGNKISVSLSMINLTTGLNERNAAEWNICSPNSVASYDIDNLIHNFITQTSSDIMNDVNLTELVREKQNEIESLKTEVKELESPKNLYTSLGASYSYSSEGHSVGTMFGLKMRINTTVGFYHMFRIKQNPAANLDGYFTYDEYSKDYSITGGYENDFIFHIGADHIAAVGGVALDTYTTDSKTDLWSEQGDYSYSHANDNKFTAAGFMFGATVTAKGNLGFYNLTVMYRNVNSHHSVAVSLNFDI